MPFCWEEGDLAGVWSRGKNWTTDLRLGVPSAFDQDLLEGYLLSSPDEEFDGEIVINHCVHIEERRVHGIQFASTTGSTWPRREE